MKTLENLKNFFSDFLRLNKNKKFTHKINENYLTDHTLAKPCTIVEIFILFFSNR